MSIAEIVEQLEIAEEVDEYRQYIKTRQLKQSIDDMIIEYLN